MELRPRLSLLQQGDVPRLGAVALLLEHRPDQGFILSALREKRVRRHQVIPLVLGHGHHWALVRWDSTSGAWPRLPCFDLGAGTHVLAPALGTGYHFRFLLKVVHILRFRASCCPGLESPLGFLLVGAERVFWLWLHRGTNGAVDRFVMHFV